MLIISIQVKNKNFHTILSVTLAIGIGNVLNKKESKGFHLDYLTKLSGVKDTVEKKSLMFHITSKVRETFPECSDLYSEIDPLIRASRTNYSELEADLGVTMPVTMSRFQASLELTLSILSKLFSKMPL